MKKFFVFLTLAIVLVLLSKANADEFRVTEVSEDAAELEYINADTVKIWIAVSKKPDFPNPTKDEKSLVQGANIILDDLKPYSENSYLIYSGDSPKAVLPFVGLKPGSTYYIRAYYLKDSDNLTVKAEKSFTTLPPEPEKQASYLVFKRTSDMKPTDIELMWKRGDGDGAIAVVCKDEKPTAPEDGKLYEANPSYGAGNSSIKDKGYVVYDGAGENVKITDLPYGYYHFQVFEYNDANGARNYNAKEARLNPREKETPLPPPVALEAKYFENRGFWARWKKVEGAVRYELDVARDSNFTDYVGEYKKMDVGDISKMPVVGVKAGNYFYRVKAIGRRARSPYSNVIKIVFEERGISK